MGAQQNIDEAMHLVRGSMELMLERDARLHELQDKSSSLSETSNSFAQRAQRLQWQYRWHRLRTRLLACTLCLWLALSYAFCNHSPVFFSATGVLFTTAFVADVYIARCLRSTGSDPQEEYSALHVQV